MAEIKDLLTSLHLNPTLVALLTLAVSFWPQVRAAWIEWTEGRNEFDYHQRRLELLKLECEIEALRKQNDLTDERFAPNLPPFTPRGSRAAARQSIPRMQRFVFGALGATATSVLGLIFLFIFDDGVADALFWVVMTVLWLTSTGVSGSVALALGRYNKWHAFAIGVVIPLAIVALIRQINNA
jgi:hypothetical protein